MSGERPAFPISPGQPISFAPARPGHGHSCSSQSAAGNATWNLDDNNLKCLILPNDSQEFKEIIMNGVDVGLPFKYNFYLVRELRGSYVNNLHISEQKQYAEVINGHEWNLNLSVSRWKKLFQPTFDIACILYRSKQVVGWTDYKMASIMTNAPLCLGFTPLTEQNIDSFLQANGFDLRIFGREAKRPRPDAAPAPAPASATSNQASQKAIPPRAPVDPVTKGLFAQFMREFMSLGRQFREGDRSSAGEGAVRSRQEDEFRRRIGRIEDDVAVMKKRLQDQLGDSDVQNAKFDFAFNREFDRSFRGKIDAHLRSLQETEAERAKAFKDLQETEAKRAKVFEENQTAFQELFQRLNQQMEQSERSDSTVKAIESSPQPANGYVQTEDEDTEIDTAPKDKAPGRFHRSYRENPKQTKVDTSDQEIFDSDEDGSHQEERSAKRSCSGNSEGERDYAEKRFKAS